MILQVGVKVLFKDNRNRVLLLRRSKQLSVGVDTDDSWDIPGGRIEAGETLDTALAREVKEEIGIDLKGTPTLLRAQDILVPKKDLHVVRLTYIHEQVLGEIKLSDEHNSYNWVSIRQAKQLTLEPFLKEVIDSL